jgi:hypothetical protein
MSGPTVRLLPTCPCCGQSVKPGWQRQPRWGRFVSFGGRGRIAPLNDLLLTIPSDLVRQAAAVAGWPESPDSVVANVFAVADVLTIAGWSRASQVGQHPPAASAQPTPTTAPALPWPTTWPR